MKTYDLTDFDLIRIIRSEGSIPEKVLLVKLKGQNDKVVLKFVIGGDDKINTEVCVFRKLKSARLPFIVKCFGIVKDRNNAQFTGILTEYIETGDQDWTFKPSSNDALIFMHELIVAAIRLHQKGIVHRDLRPSNVFYHKKRRQITVIDFGCADFVDCQRSSCNVRGLLYPVYEKILDEIVKAIGKQGPSLDEYEMIERAVNVPHEMVQVQENIYLGTLIAKYAPQFAAETTEDAQLFDIAADIRAALFEKGIKLKEPRLHVPPMDWRGYNKMQTQFYASVRKTAREMLQLHRQGLL